MSPTPNPVGSGNASGAFGGRTAGDDRRFPETIPWPDPPFALLVMGKRQGTKRVNRQLHARVARAAALWRDAPDPKPLVLFVAADANRSGERDAEWVRRTLVENGGLPAERVFARPLSDCTFVEVRTARDLAVRHGFERILAVTHPYHAPRARRYLREVLPGSEVVAVPQSQPQGLDAIREGALEWILQRIHSLDSRGRIERGLAARLRGR